MIISLLNSTALTASYVLGCYYCALMSMLLLFIFMKTNKIFSPRVRRYFYGVIMTVIALCIGDSICIIYLTNDNPCFFQILFMAIGYALRPLVALFVYYIVMRRSRKLHILIWIPEIINVLVAFSALFSPLAFSYNDMNQYVRGPLGYTTHLTSLFYVVLIIIGTMKKFREKSFSEFVLLGFLALVMITAVLLDMMLRMWLTVPAISVGVTFYYLYFHSEAQMRDSLTNAYSRKRFYMDAEKYHNDICGLIGFDLNDLKLLNDTQGHAIGDKALITMTDIIQLHMPRRSRLYRTGGDEFVVLCRRVSPEAAEKFISNVKSAMSVTPFRCAAGLAYNRDNTDIDTLYKAADEQMYQDKTRMKAGRNYREHTRE